MLKNEKMDLNRMITIEIEAVSKGRYKRLFDRAFSFLLGYGHFCYLIVNKKNFPFFYLCSMVSTF